MTETEANMNMKERLQTGILTILALAGLWVIPMMGDSNCSFLARGAAACPNAHTWFYLPVGVFLSAVVLTAYRVIMPLGLGWRVGLSPDLIWPRSDIALQCGIIVAGYLAALCVRAVHTPVIYHNYVELQPRYEVGLALVLLMFVPASKSWLGTICSLASCALILSHWFG